MQIRRNTKAFKTILQIFSDCQDRGDRDKLIRLYITRAGQSIKERINIEGIEGESALFYDMTFQSAMSNLKSPNHQLHQSDEIPGIYFFHSTSNKAWDETPFEFDEAVKNEFGSLPELPVLRKKGKAEKYVFPTATESKKSKEKPLKKPVGKPKADNRKAVMYINKGPKQPDYKLAHPIEFTNLERIIFRSAQLSKNDVLDYYNQASEYILPYVKDRPVSIRMASDNARSKLITTLEELSASYGDDIPAWVQTSPARKTKSGAHLLLCPDKEHVLFYVEAGAIAIETPQARAKSPDTPDYLLIGIDADTEFSKAIEVILAAKEIFTGLQMPAFIKTDGVSGFHIYIPCDSKSEFEVCQRVAEYLCKLIRLKTPDLVTINGSDEASYGKVALDSLVNDAGTSIVAPYAFASAQSPVVSTPLLWEEVNAELKIDEFIPATIFKRLKQTGDPFEAFMKKKINAAEFLKRLEDNYSFLF